MIDVDHFKLFNDRYGHLEGDQVLRAVSKCMQASVVRASDAISRFGGEEFVALLPGADTQGALAAAERLRGNVERLQIPHAGSAYGIVSVSIGVAVAYPSRGGTNAELLKLADLALYDAKRSGRNCVKLAQPEADPASSAASAVSDADQYASAMADADHQAL